MHPCVLTHAQRAFQRFVYSPNSVTTSYSSQPTAYEPRTNRAAGPLAVRRTPTFARQRSHRGSASRVARTFFAHLLPALPHFALERALVVRRALLARRRRARWTECARVPACRACVLVDHGGTAPGLGRRVVYAPDDDVLPARVPHSVRVCGLSGWCALGRLEF
jgi:hypothetical protein